MRSFKENYFLQTSANFLGTYELHFEILLPVDCPGTLIKRHCNRGGVQGGEFRTLKSCLENVRKSSGQAMKIEIDKPDKVIGFLRNGEMFSCIRKESGTKGVYFEGRYNTK